MPSTYNGVGTRYIGKKNVHGYQGQCQSCGHVTTLKCYDTRLCVVVLFIPVFPLGRKRILDYCSICTRHYAMPHKEWQVADQRAQATTEAYRQSPTDPQLAHEAVAARVSLRDIPGFLALAPEIERNCAADAKTLCMVASAYELFNRTADAERVLRQAVEVKEEDDVCEMLADNLIRQDRPDEAEPYLLHIVDKGVPDRIDNLYQLAQAYQRKGDHDKALEYFGHMEAVNPLITNDKTFNKLKAESTRRLGTGASFSSMKMIQKERSSAAWRRGFKIVAAIATIAFIGYVATAWFQGNFRKVILASGVDRPYSIRLNGKQYDLKPMDITPVRLTEGDIKLEFVDPPFAIETETLPIKTNFWSRPFNSRVFVINPDRAALLSRTRVFYSTKSYLPAGMNGGPPPQEHYLVGRTLHEVDRVDYVFEDPPEKVSTKSKDREVEKVVLTYASGQRDVSPSVMLLHASEQTGQGAAIFAAQRRLLLEPDNNELLNLLHMLITPQELADFLRPGLEKRPILLQWHRSYQTALDSTDQQPQVAKEYDALLAKEPENKDLMYLAGRASRNIDRNYQLCAKAAAGDNPCGFALHSIGGYHLEIGDFARAVEHSGRAVQLLPKESDVRYYHKLALLAAGKYPRLLELVREDESKPYPVCLSAFSEEVLIHNLTGKRGEVEGVVHRLRQRLHGTNRSTIDQEVTLLQAVDNYCAGNPSQYSWVLKNTNDPNDRFVAQLALGAFRNAQDEMANLKPGAYTHLLMYLACARTHPDLAAKNLQSAIDFLQKGDTDEKMFAKALVNPSSVPINDLVRLRRYPASKLILLSAVGLRHPSVRTPCFSLARKLNFDRRFPHLLIKSVLETR